METKYVIEMFDVEILLNDTSYKRGMIINIQYWLDRGLFRSIVTGE
jgi:hypothetical protein